MVTFPFIPSTYAGVTICLTLFLPLIQQHQCQSVIFDTLYRGPTRPKMWFMAGLGVSRTVLVSIDGIYMPL